MFPATVGTARLGALLAAAAVPVPAALPELCVGEAPPVFVPGEAVTTSATGTATAAARARISTVRPARRDLNKPRPGRLSRARRDLNSPARGRCPPGGSRPEPPESPSPGGAVAG